MAAARLRPSGASHVAPETLAFQTDIDALVGERMPLVLRAWPALGAGLLAALLVTAAFTRVDIVVTASGRLMSEAPPVVLQPIGSAVLREMRVRPGETVEAGQVLAVLDSTFTAADLEALVSQRRTLSAQRDRLEAELAGGAQVAASSDPEISLQGDLQSQRRSLLAARRSAIRAELDALAAAEAAEARSGAGLDDQMQIALEIEAMRVTLEADKVGSKLSVLTARAARLQAAQEIERHAARLEDLRHRKAARAADLEAFERDWERQTIEELSRVRPDLARVEEQLAKATRLDALTQLRGAPQGRGARGRPPVAGVADARGRAGRLDGAERRAADRRGIAAVGRRGQAAAGRRDQRQDRQLSMAQARCASR